MKKIISILLLSFLFISNSFAGGNFLQQKAEKIINNFSKRIQNDPASKKNELTIYENVATTMYKILNKNTLKKSQKELLVFLLEELNAKRNLLDLDYYDLSGKVILGGGNEPFWSIEINENTIFFTDYSEKNPTKKIYRTTATLAQEEITLDTVIGPFFVLTEQECTNDMNGYSYDYTIFAYIGGVEKLTGCANEKIDFSKQEYSGGGSEPFWGFNYKNGKVTFSKPGENNIIKNNYNVKISQNGNGFSLGDDDDTFSISFTKKDCIDDTKGDTHKWTVEAYQNGTNYKGCAD